MNLSRNQTKGLRGESYAVAELTKNGYIAHLRPIFNDNYDATISHPAGRLHLEVKTAYPTKYPRGWLWQFNLENLDRSQDSVVILLAIAGDERFIFVAPSWLFLGRRKVALTSHPRQYVKRGRGWLARYYERWQSIDEVGAACRRLSGSQQMLPGLAG